MLLPYLGWKQMAWHREQREVLAFGDLKKIFWEV